ncbi:MAG: DUF2911 domain-containing protein [Chitinophagaceae bacterium]|nr:DUF2911 domain-containing protein [Chitinophagaceae bacterium]
MILMLACSILACSSFAQLTTSTYGGNKSAWVGERIGLTEVTIKYNRPHVKGREGKIWGTLVKEGFFTPDFTNNKATPWRAGANESTTISFSNDVKVEGKPLPAGKYSLFVAYGPSESIVIFSKNSTSWGSYFYDQKEDALRVTVKPVPADKSYEWLTYQFADETDSTATVQLAWEKLIIPFKIEANVTEDQIASFRRELRGEKGFNWQSFDQAAQWCANKNVNIDEALLWADSATSPLFGGDKEFQPWATKARLLTIAGRENEAAEVMKKAMPLASVQEIHQYGRQLLAAKKNKEALEIFKLNASKHPNQFTPYVGLARGYSANGDYKNALKNAQLALPLAPDPVNKTNVENMIAKLKEGKDIN